MNIKTSLLLTILAMIGCVGAISAQVSAMRVVSVSARIVEGMALSQTTSLNFGTNIKTTTEGGSVILASNSSTRNYTGGLTSSKSTNQNATNATFEISGSSLATYAITLPAAITLTHTSIDNGINTMVVTSIKARFNEAESDSVTSSINSNGTDRFTLGGTLNVQENQISGQYSGQYEVCVNYN
jgi:hypothetical protein